MNRSKLHGIYQHVIQITFNQTITLAYKITRVAKNSAKRKMLLLPLPLLPSPSLKNRILVLITTISELHLKKSWRYFAMHYPDVYH